MRILYGCSNCSKKKYEELFRGKNIAVMQSGQKYHNLMLKGLAQNGADVISVSGLPINRTVESKLFINSKDEKEDNVYYHYYKSINLPLLRQFSIFLGALLSVFRYKKKNDKNFIICDAMSIANAYGMILGAKILRIPVIFIFLDLPDMITKNNIVRAINNYIFYAADGFLFLTEQMNKKVNLKNKPYIVAEGHVDSETNRLLQNGQYEKSGKKVIIYAGGIKKIYGIKELTEGFMLADIPDSELWIFGDGDFREELEEIAKENNNIKYMGVCSNEEVVEEEKKASLLVNPRPSEPEYTKYSFPSKNMEYMVSGTPVLTTKLPGMPDEYLPYIYLIEDETAEGISKALEKVFSDSSDKREKKGISAREFVLKNKSNIVQAKRIVDFLKIFNAIKPERQ